MNLDIPQEGSYSSTNLRSVSFYTYFGQEFFLKWNIPLVKSQFERAWT